MARSIDEQIDALLIVGKEFRETTGKLIAMAQKLKPEIKTRTEALQLAEDITQGRFKLGS